MASVNWIGACCGAFAGTLAVSPVHALTSSELLTRVPVAQYEAVKSTIQGLFEETPSNLKPAIYQGAYGLNSCSRTGTEYVADGKGAEIAEIALNAVTWTSDLGKIGYPERIWKELVLGYERDMLKAVVQTGIRGDDQVFKRRLVSVLKSFRAAHKPVLPPVLDNDEGGCGGGNPGVDITIKTDPQGAQVMLIPVFYYRLCKKQMIDPEDLGRCDHWFEALDTAKTNIAGQYLYSIHWSHNETRRGTLTDTASKDDDVVILRKK